MPALKIVLMSGGLGMIVAAVSILACDVRRAWAQRRSHTSNTLVLPVERNRWSTSIALGLLAWGPILLAVSVLVILRER